nr:hypothetical protein [Tanacetum cinerariifolium]
MPIFFRSCSCIVVRYRVIILLAYSLLHSSNSRSWIFLSILISLDSSEESVGTSTARAILFGTIPTTIPSTAPTTDLPVIHDDTPLIHPPFHPLYPLYHLLLSLFSTLPHSLTLTHLTVTFQRDHHPRTRMSQFLLVDPIVPSPMGVLKMLTAKKSVGSLPTHQLALRYSTDYSSLDHFTSDDSSRDSPPDSSLETSSDSHSDTSSDSFSRHSSLGNPILDSPCDSPIVASTGPSCKRHRDSNSMTDLEVISEEGYVPYVPREVGLRVDVEDSYEPYTEPDVDSDIQTDIDASIAFFDGIKARGTDVRVVVKTAAEEEVKSSVRDMVEIEVDPRVELVIDDDDVRESVREDGPDHVTADGAIEVPYETLGDLVQRFHDHTMEIPAHQIQRIGMLDRDNVRLRGMLDVKRQRVDRLQRSIAMPTATPSGITQDAIIELVAKRVEEALKAYDAARNPETETGKEDDQQDDHVEAEVNNGKGNENGNGNPNVNNGGINSYKRIVGFDAAYAMTWKALMKLMTEDAIRIANNLLDQKLKGYAIKNSENKK